MFNEMAKVATNQWGHVEELLRLIAERLDVLLRVTVMANRDQKRAAPDFGAPFHYPRPGEAKTSIAVRPRDVARKMLGGG